MCSSVRPVSPHPRRHPFRFPIPLSLILAALLGVAGPAGAQQTFFIDTLVGPSWPYPDYPNGVAVAGDGTMYVADRGSHTVMRVETDGSLSIFAGTSDSAGFSGDGDAATNARLNTPTGVAVTADDSTVYIADRLNNRVRKVDVATRIITTVAGTGNAGFSGDGGPVAVAVLNNPIDVAVDSSDNVYIADLYNHRVRKVTVSTGVIATIAGSGTYGPGLGGDGGDNGPATAARLNNPIGVMVDGDGNVYIGDFRNHRVRKVDVSADPPTISTFAGTGTIGFSGDGGQATAARLNSPIGLAMAGDGTVYVADAGNRRIRKVATDGVITTVAGGAPSFRISTIYQDGIQATTALLWNPRDVALDSSGNFYIAMQGLGNFGAIRKVDTSGVITTAVGGNGSGLSGDGGPAQAARLSSPGGVTVDSSGNVYIADTSNNRIRKVDTSGIITTLVSTWKGIGLSALRGLAVDSSNKVYAASGNRILKFDGSTDPPTITSVAGAAFAGDTGDGGLATAAKLNSPSGVALDSNDNIYIADTQNHRIRKVTASTGVITTIAGTGTDGFSGDSGAATAAQLDSPSGVAVDSAGDVYIADTTNDRIRKIDVSESPPTISTIAGSATAGLRGDGGLATAARLNNPRDVAVASDGTVYIADDTNRRIRAVASNGIISTVAGRYDPNLPVSVTQRTSLPGVPDGSLATAANLSGPQQLAVSSAGAVYIVESSGHRVSRLTTAAPPRAFDASRLTSAGTPVTINLRVFDPNGDTVTVTVTTPPSNGMATVSDLTIRYTPNAGFTGVDTFAYTVSDGQGGSATATVRVRVEAAAEAPPPPSTGGAGGTGRRQPTDHHGNTPATATPLAPTARVGGLLHSGDQDYFRLVLPHAGLLHVETIGWSNTVGTVWQGGVELGSAELGGRLYNFKLGVPVQAGPVIIRVTERSRTASGAYRLYTRFIAGAIEPPPLTVQNGLGMVAGWLCSADPVVLEIDGLPYHPASLPAPVPEPPGLVVGFSGSEPPPRAVDPHDLCDDTATGFGLPLNWNLLGDGEHTLIARLDGIEFARTVVDVTTLGEEFVHDAHGTCSVPDFPLPDHTVNLVWQEAGQHFALSDGQTPPPVGATRASDVRGRLETPAPGSFQSGRGVISGWVCDAAEVSVEIDGTPYPVAYGLERLDVAAVCETPAPGFGLSLDWNRLGPGDHEVVALANGAEFGRATVRVTTLGAAFRRDAGTAFVRGLAGACVVDDFPAPGEAVHLEWQEATQNFVITGVE